MKATAFNPKTRQWERQFPGCLAQHDIIWETPPEDALQGIPIGNGDLGLLLWTEGSRLIAAVNKVDLFDDYPAPGGAWSTSYQGDRTEFPGTDPVIAECRASSNCARCSRKR